MRSPLPRFEVVGARRSVITDHGHFVVAVATSDDEYAAYRRLVHLRQHSDVAKDALLIGINTTGDQPHYSLFLLLSRDLLASVWYVERLRAEGILGQHATPFVTTRANTQRWLGQAELMHAVYSRIPSATHHTQRNRSNVGGSDASTEPVVAYVSAVSEIYSIPLDFFAEMALHDPLYLDPQGLIREARWTARPGIDDITLARRRDVVLTIPRRAPSWQITEQTIHYVHQLPGRPQEGLLRFRRTLEAPAAVGRELTTAALVTSSALVLRDLIDRFQGDYSRALCAYRSDAEDPNVRQEVGVRRSALYAKAMLQQAAGIARATAKAW